METWLLDHREAFEILAEERRIAGKKKLREVIQRNMVEFVGMLVEDSDLLPSEAAEEIAINRIAAGEMGKTVADLCSPIPKIARGESVRKAAAMLVRGEGDLLAVVDSQDVLVGVLTDRDITAAAAISFSPEAPVEQIMTADVIYAGPGDSILEVVRKLEYYEISAMPVVEESPGNRPDQQRYISEKEFI